MARPVVFTFDDGPGPSTPRLLDVLHRHGASATFFVLGRNVMGHALDGDGDRARDIVVRAIREGHVIGNHTMTHAKSLPDAALIEELEACDRMVRELYTVAGKDPPPTIPVRLPFAHYRPDHPRGFQLLESIGRSSCNYTCAFYDWRTDRPPQVIAASMQSHVQWEWMHRRTPVLLLHDSGQGQVDGEDDVGVVREITVDAVDRACEWLCSKKCTFQTVLECAPEALHYKLESATAVAAT